MLNLKKIREIFNVSAITFIAIFMFCLLPAEVHAAKVVKVKNGKAIIDSEGDELNVGESYIAVDENLKKRARISITRVQENRALAKIEKGVLQVGFTLQATADGSFSDTSSEKKSGKEKQSWGLQGSYAQNTMTVSFTSATVSLTGTNTNFAGFYQLELSPTISVKLALSYDSLTTAGTASSAVCAGSTACTVDISYLGLDTLIRYSFSRTKTLSMWGAAGMAFLVAMSKSSNAIDTSKISTNQRLELALGADVYYSKKQFVPVEFKYSMFPSTSTTSVSQIFLGLGWGTTY